MRRPVSVILALSLLLTLLAAMAIPAAAMSVNRIDRVQWLASDFKGVAATMTIREEDSYLDDFRDGDSFRLMLKPGIKWLRDSSGYVDANGNPVTPTISNTNGTANLLINIVSDTTMSITLPNDVGGLSITDNNSQDILHIPLSVDLNGQIGNMYVTIDPMSSAVSGSTGNGDEFSSVYDGTNTAANQPQITETGVKGWNDIAAAMLKAGAGSKYTVKLSGNNTAPASLFNNIKDKNITVRFEPSSQIALEINGKDVTGSASATEIDLSLDTREIPRSMYSDFSGVLASRQFAVNSGSPDDFSYTLYILLDKNQAKKQATLFCKDGDKLEKLAVATVDAKGWCAFDIKLIAGDYIVLAGDKEFDIKQEQNPEPVTPPEEKPSPPVWVNPFIDVAANDWFYSAIQFVSENGIFTGTGSNTFSPNINLSRGMLVTAIWRNAGKPAQGSNNFSDVPQGEWFSAAVDWAAENGILKGYENGTFRPMEPVNREEMAAIFYRYARHIGADVSISDTGGSELIVFADWSSVSGWAQEMFIWSYENKIIQGKTTGTITLLDPQGLATRAEAATIFMRTGN